MTKPINIPDLVEDLEWLLSCDVGLTEASKRLGYAPLSLERTLLRHEQRDLVVRLRDKDYRPLDSRYDYKAR